MNKKMRELFAKINEKTAALRTALDNKNLDEAETINNELRQLNREYDFEKSMFEQKKREGAPTPEQLPADPVRTKDESIKSFAQAAKSGFKSMNEGTPADGGYVVPQDISTQITELRSAKSSLRDYVNVVQTMTNKGSRPYKKRAQQTGFTRVGEGAKAGRKATPQFGVVNYEIGKYAGWLPVTNELLKDTDVNIANTIMSWIADEARVTDNKLIIEQLTSKTAVNLNDLDGIKKAINVTLGQAFKNTAAIYTNDDGLNYLDTLKDTTGRYLLTPDPTNPANLRLSVGASTIPVVVIPNADFATTSKKVPFIIGDLYEAIMLFDRQSLTIETSKEATVGELNLFEQDMTAFRAIMREDVELRDDEAFVNGYITVS